MNDQQSQQEQKLLTISQFADQLQISKSTVWNWIREKRIKKVKIGPKLIRIHIDEINKIINKNNPPNPG